MAKVESRYINFKEGTSFDFALKYDGTKAQIQVCIDKQVDEEVIADIDVDQDFMITLFLDYLTEKDLPYLLRAIYYLVGGKSEFEKMITKKINEAAETWTIYIDPYIYEYPTTPNRSELEYKIKKIQTPFRKFDLDDICGTDDNIRLPSEDIDKYIDSFKKKELDAAFYEKYMDDIVRHPEHYDKT